jgi:hypothetical protein
MTTSRSSVGRCLSSRLAQRDLNLAVTGLSVEGPELAGKRLQLLIDAVKRRRRAIDQKRCSLPCAERSASSRHWHDRVTQGADTTLS